VGESIGGEGDPQAAGVEMALFGRGRAVSRFSCSTWEGVGSRGLPMAAYFGRTFPWSWSMVWRVTLAEAGTPRKERSSWIGLPCWLGSARFQAAMNRDPSEARVR